MFDSSSTATADSGHGSTVEGSVSTFDEGGSLHSAELNRRRKEMAAHKSE